MQIAFPFSQKVVPFVWSAAPPQEEGEEQEEGAAKALDIAESRRRRHESRRHELRLRKVQAIEEMEAEKSISESLMWKAVLETAGSLEYSQPLKFKMFKPAYLWNGQTNDGKMWMNLEIQDKVFSGKVLREKAEEKVGNGVNKEGMLLDAGNVGVGNDDPLNLLDLSQGTFLPENSINNNSINPFVNPSPTLATREKLGISDREWTKVKQRLLKDHGKFQFWMGDKNNLAECFKLEVDRCGVLKDMKRGEGLKGDGLKDIDFAKKKSSGMNRNPGTTSSPPDSSPSTASFLQKSLDKGRTRLTTRASLGVLLRRCLALTGLVFATKGDTGQDKRRDEGRDKARAKPKRSAFYSGGREPVSIAKQNLSPAQLAGANARAARYLAEVVRAATTALPKSARDAHHAPGSDGTGSSIILSISPLPTSNTFNATRAGTASTKYSRFWAQRSSDNNSVNHIGNHMHNNEPGNHRSSNHVHTNTQSGIDNMQREISLNHNDHMHSDVNTNNMNTNTNTNTNSQFYPPSVLRHLNQTISCLLSPNPTHLTPSNGIVTPKHWRPNMYDKETATPAELNKNPYLAVLTWDIDQLDYTDGIDFKPDVDGDVILEADC